MSTLTISNLEQNYQLDRDAMSAIHGGSSGGNSWLQGLGPIANVNVGVDVIQNVSQLQKVDVYTLNNVGSIGPGFGPLHMNVSPSQMANVATIF